MTAYNFKDLTGQRFGELVVLERVQDKITNSGKRVTQWLCRCSCGKETVATTQRLTTGHTTSCGCKTKNNKGSRFEDLTGQRFNRLTVIRYLDKNERTARTYNWLCQCDCGRLIKANANKLKNGLQKSCGCLKEEMKYDIGDINRKYKYSNKRLYGVYKSMINRCYNESHREYNNYGGRGVTVCDLWRNNYDDFAEWAFKTGYDDTAIYGQCTLDRKDVNGNYEPCNCTWVTNEAQQNNRRDNVILTYNGETHNMKEWSRLLGVTYSSLVYHIRKKGRTLEEFMSIKK